MKFFYLFSYLFLAWTILAKSSNKDIKIAFPVNDGSVTTTDASNNGFQFTITTPYFLSETSAVNNDIPYESCVYDVNKNKVICKFTNITNDVTKYFHITFNIKNKPTCSLTQKTKFTKISSFSKENGKFFFTPYSAYYEYEGKKISQFSFTVRRFQITDNTGCKFNANISSASLSTVKKANY